MNRRQRIFAAVVIALLLLSGGATLWMASCGLAGCPSDEQLRGSAPARAALCSTARARPSGGCLTSAGSTSRSHACLATSAPRSSRAARVQPRARRTASAGVGVQAVRLCGGDCRGLYASEYLAEEAAFLITSMLRSMVDEGTGHFVRELGVMGPVAGKTGTTSNGADIWFVGYTPTEWCPQSRDE